MSPYPRRHSSRGALRKQLNSIDEDLTLAYLDRRKMTTSRSVTQIPVRAVKKQKASLFLLVLQTNLVASIRFKSCSPIHGNHLEIQLMAIDSN